MSPVLRTLLGQGVGVPAAEQIHEGIVVPGKRLPTEQVPGPPVVSPDDTQRMLLERYKGNLDNSDFIRARQEAVRAGEKASDRRGMFGVKGTLRDILGVLGDAFLIQSGNAPIYGPTRREERISDAMAAFVFLLRLPWFVWEGCDVLALRVLLSVKSFHLTLPDESGILRSR